MSARGQYRIETWKTRRALNFERCAGLLSQLSTKAFDGQQILALYLRFTSSGIRSSEGKGRAFESRRVCQTSVLNQCIKTHILKAFGMECLHGSTWLGFTYGLVSGKGHRN